MKKPSKVKKIKAKPLQRVGILNAYGDFWTPETFSNQEDAHKYVEDFWKKINFGHDFKYLLVLVEIKVIRKL